MSYIKYSYNALKYKIYLSWHVFFAEKMPKNIK